MRESYAILPLAILKLNPYDKESLMFAARSVIDGIEEMKQRVESFGATLFSADDRD